MSLNRTTMAGGTTEAAERAQQRDDAKPAVQINAGKSD